MGWPALRRAALAALFFALSAHGAWAQGSTLQAGPPAAGLGAMYAPDSGFGQGILQASGLAIGGGAGLGLSEWLQQARAPGTGPFMSHSCSWDTYAANPAGAHYFCFDPNSDNYATIAVGWVGNAAPQQMRICIELNCYPFPGASTGTVTSVTFTGDGTVLSSVPSAPVTTSGTLPATLNTQAPHTVLAGPSTGISAMFPTFRELTCSDLSDAGPACNATNPGTVTSVGLTGPGGIFAITGSPVTTSGNLGFTTTGTSGGVPYFSRTAVVSSSALLTLDAPVIGGGAGAAPSVGSRSGNTTTFGTTSGSLPNGDYAKFDSSGNIVDGGSAIGCTAPTSPAVVYAIAGPACSGDATNFFFTDASPRLLTLVGNTADSLKGMVFDLVGADSNEYGAFWICEHVTCVTTGTGHLALGYTDDISGRPQGYIDCSIFSGTFEPCAISLQAHSGLGSVIHIGSDGGLVPAPNAMVDMKNNRGKGAYLVEMWDNGGGSAIMGLLDDNTGSCEGGTLQLASDSNGLSSPNVILRACGAGSNNAYLYFKGLPSSDPHVVGEVWNNSGVMTVSAG